MRRHQFAVLGLGSFGQTIATELTRLGNEVLGIDYNERRVDLLADAITHTVVADVSDEKALRELNIQDFDAAVVAIGENIEASILATLNLRSIGVKSVWVKALTAQHHRILAKVGATRIIHPEHEMGLRVAQSLNYPIVNNYMELGDDEYLVEIIVSEQLSGSQMSQVFAAAKTEVSVLLVRRDGRNYQAPGVVPENMVLDQGDHVVLLGSRADLKQVARHL